MRSGSHILKLFKIIVPHFDSRVRRERERGGGGGGGREKDREKERSLLRDVRHYIGLFAQNSFDCTESGNIQYIVRETFASVVFHHVDGRESTGL